MNVSLTPELERRISQRVESGLYTTASEVVREGLRLLFEGGQTQESRLARLEADIAVGLDQLDRGEGLAGEEVRAALTARIDAKRPPK